MSSVQDGCFTDSAISRPKAGYVQLALRHADSPTVLYVSGSDAAVTKPEHEQSAGHLGDAHMDRCEWRSN